MGRPAHTVELETFLNRRLARLDRKPSPLADDLGIPVWRV